MLAEEVTPACLPFLAALTFWLPFFMFFLQALANTVWSIIILREEITGFLNYVALISTAIGFTSLLIIWTLLCSIKPQRINIVNRIISHIRIEVHIPTVKPNRVFAYVNPVRLVQSGRHKANIFTAFGELRFINGCCYFSLLFETSYAYI